MGMMVKGFTMETKLNKIMVLFFFFFNQAFSCLFCPALRQEGSCLCKGPWPVLWAVGWKIHLPSRPRAVVKAWRAPRHSINFVRALQWVCHAHDWAVVFPLCFDWRDFLFDLPMHRTTLAWTRWALLRLKRKYFLLFLRYFLSQSVRVAEVAGQQYRVCARAAQAVGQAREVFGQGDGCHPQVAMSIRCPVFLSLKRYWDITQSPTATGCIQLHEEMSTELLKYASRGMCNFHHFPPWERWDFSLRGVHVVLTLETEYVPPREISQPGPPPQSSQGFWFPLAGGMPWKNYSWRNWVFAGLITLHCLQSLKHQSWYAECKKGKVVRTCNVA